MSAKVYCYLVPGLLFITIISCAPAYTAVSAVTPTSSLVINSNVITTAVPLLTVTPSPTEKPPLNFFFPKIEQYCPENREVPISELGISNNLQIILSDLDQTGLWNYSVENPLPRLIRELPLDKWTSSSISPDGKRLVYTIWNPDHSSSTWLFSLATGEHREVLNIEYWDGLAPYVRWLSSQELLIVNSCHTKGCHFPLKILNIITGESEDVDSIDSGPYDDYLTFYKNTEKNYALYSAGNVGNDYIDFYVYDYLPSQKIQAFPWLQNRIFFYPYIGTNLGLIFGQDSVAMIVEQSYGFDFGIVDSSIETLTQKMPYDDLMKRVVTDSSFGELSFSSVIRYPSNENLLLSMNYKDYINWGANDDFSTEPEVVEDAFFVLDLENPIVDPQISYLTFRDYCFTTTGYYIKGVSPDGQIVVFGSDNELAFMNLKTGYVTYLPNWQFVGWSK